MKKAVVKKEPKKNFKNKNWVFENYNGENITLDKQGEDIDKGFVYNFYSCSNMEIRLVGKIKSVNLEGCKKVALYVDSVIAEVALMNCNSIKVFGKDNLKTLTAENTNEVYLHLTHKTIGCKLFTTCARSVWIRFPKEGADDTDNDQVNWHRAPIAEIYETCVKGDSIVTIPAESLE